MLILILSVLALIVICTLFMLFIMPIAEAYSDSGRMERRAEKWRKRFEVKDDE